MDPCAEGEDQAATGGIEDRVAACEQDFAWC